MPLSPRYLPAPAPDSPRPPIPLGPRRTNFIYFYIIFTFPLYSFSHCFSLNFPDKESASTVHCFSPYRGSRVGGCPLMGKHNEQCWRIYIYIYTYLYVPEHLERNSEYKLIFYIHLNALQTVWYDFFEIVWSLNVCVCLQLFWNRFDTFHPIVYWTGWELFWIMFVLLA